MCSFLIVFTNSFTDVFDVDECYTSCENLSAMQVGVPKVFNYVHTTHTHTLAHKHTHTRTHTNTHTHTHIHV